MKTSDIECLPIPRVERFARLHSNTNTKENVMRRLTKKQERELERLGNSLWLSDRMVADMVKSTILKCQRG